MNGKLLILLFIYIIYSIQCSENAEAAAELNTIGENTNSSNSANNSTENATLNNTINVDANHTNIITEINLSDKTTTASVNVSDSQAGLNNTVELNLNNTENIKEVNNTDDAIHNITESTNDTTAYINANVKNIRELENHTHNIPSDNHVENTITNESTAQLTPESDANLDKWHDFNLTNEVEKLYNQSQYESTEEEALIREAEAIHEEKHQPSEEELKERRLRKEWEEQVSTFIASDILTIKIRGKDYHVIHFNLELLRRCHRCSFLRPNRLCGKQRKSTYRLLHLRPQEGHYTQNKEKKPNLPRICCHLHRHLQTRHRQCKVGGKEKSFSCCSFRQQH